MRRPHRILILVLCLGWLAGSLATATWAKVPNARPQKKKTEAPRGPLTIPIPVTEPRCTITEADKPQTFLARAQEQERAGDLGDSLQTIMKFVNLYPNHPQRPAVLLNAARLARGLGEIDKAVHLNDLTVFLKPDADTAAQARRQAATLELYLELPHRDPLVALRQFLTKLTPWPSGRPLDTLREPLQYGWQEVSKWVYASTQVPVTRLEEILALWDLHPSGSQPPEAALLVGELLQKQGLLGEARGFYHRLQEQGPSYWRTAALVGVLEIVCDSGDLSELASTLLLWKENQGEVTPELKRRLTQLPLPEDLLLEPQNLDQEQVARAEPLELLLGWWCGKTPDAGQQAALLRCLEHYLRRPLPAALKEKVKSQLAHLQWSQGNFPQAAKTYQELLASNTSGNNSAFYQDRLGLTQVKAQRPDRAQEIFHTLGQEEDQLWQMLSRTRLMDVELDRAQKEPSHD